MLLEVGIFTILAILGVGYCESKHLARSSSSGLHHGSSLSSGWGFQDDALYSSHQVFQNHTS